MKKKFLIVIDMQKDFVDGSLGTKEAQAIVPRVQELIDSNEFDVTLYTQDTHFDNYSDTLEGKMLPVEHCIQYTPGWDLVVKPKTEIVLDELSVRVEKYTFGSDTLGNTIAYIATDGVNTKQTWTDIGINYIDTITIVGLCTDICVISNALILRAMFPNTRIICDASACAGVTPEKHRAAIEVMKSCQIEVINETPDAM